MKNKSELAYSLIEQMITFRVLEPGSMVSESHLMELTDLGRTPIREALKKLAAEKMVEIHSRKGVLIPLMSVEVQLKLLEVRRTLEKLAVKLASHRSAVKHKNEMLKLAEQLLNYENYEDPKCFGEILKQVHRVIADSTQNEYLTMAILPLQGLSRRFWFAYIKSYQKEFSVAGQLHAAILKAICHGDEAVASKASLALNDYLTEFTYRSIRNTPN